MCGFIRVFGGNLPENRLWQMAGKCLSQCKGVNGIGIAGHDEHGYPDRGQGLGIAEGRAVDNSPQEQGLFYGMGRVELADQDLRRRRRDCIDLLKSGAARV